MGIKGLWDIIGEGDVLPLAQLATEYIEIKGRPLRIAVDEAGWRFNNLTPEQVTAIQAKEPAARPVEKAIFYRTIGLLQLNIQLLFVFDGPGRPWKRGRRGGGKIDYEKINLLQNLLRMLRVPYHQAPGEAEAECARLHEEGIVDAVWTDDGDAFMFGTEFLIRTLYEKQVKSKTHVQVFRASKIREKHRLDRQGMILFAMLAGGDYNTKGLPGCGPQTALRAAQKGLGASLYSASELELPLWRDKLADFLKRKDIAVPPDFPCAKTLKKYKEPKVSTVEQLHNLRALQGGWESRACDEINLRSFLRLRFNIQTKGYIKHILPVLLVNTLRQTPKGAETSNNMYKIELVKSRVKKAKESFERKITFLPQSVTTHDLSEQPEDEDWSKLETKANGPFDPLARADCEILECLLRRGVPYVLTRAADQENVNTSSAKRKRKSGQELEDGGDMGHTNKTPNEKALNTVSKKRKKDAASTAANNHEHNGQLRKEKKKGNSTSAEQSSTRKLPDKSTILQHKNPRTIQSPIDSARRPPPKAFKMPPNFSSLVSNPTLNTLAPVLTLKRDMLSELFSVLNDEEEMTLPQVPQASSPSTQLHEPTPEQVRRMRLAKFDRLAAVGEKTPVSASKAISSKAGPAVPQTPSKNKGASSAIVIDLTLD